MPHVNIAPVGATKVPQGISSSRDTPIGIFPSPATKDDLDDDHLRGRRRIFVGPMPENVAARLRVASASGADHVSIPRHEFSREDFARDDIAQDDTSSSSSSDPDSDSDSCHSSSGLPTTRQGHISRKRLLRAFLRKGGRREDFSEQEIRKRWNTGGWSRVPLPVDASARRWVGSSFEVGLDIVAGMSSEHNPSTHPLRDGRETEQTNGSHPSGSRASQAEPPAPSRTTTMETFVTARSSVRGGSDVEAFWDERDGDKGEPAPIDVEAIPRRKSSKSSLTPSSSGGELFPQTTRDPPSQATSTTQRPGTSRPASSSLHPKPHELQEQTRRPHSTLGVPYLLTDHDGDIKPQAASTPHLAGLLSPPKAPKGKEGTLRSALRRNLGSLRRTSSVKQRSVLFAESPKALASAHSGSFVGMPRSVSAPVTTGPSTPMEHAPMFTESPAAPAEVLNRETEPEDTTSAGAVLALQVEESHISEDGVVRRDRMLVRAAFNRSPGLPKPYDEVEAGKHPDTQEVEWKEMLVVWRKSLDKEDRIELYQDYTTPGKERILGHKDLAFIIPLDGATTNISPYSHVDLTFCLTCPPTPVRTGSTSKRARFHRAPIGTNIFVFKVKSRTRALDWTWNLWKYLGGELPETIDIHCPALGTRVRVDIPSLDRGAPGDSWKRFTRSYLIEACGRSLRGLPDWDAMMESPVLRGAKLQLAWRKESKLDWVWLELDEQGKELDWQVLYGLALRQPRLPSQLEIRLGLHTPTHVALTDGSILDEPPAIEGYLHRIKPKTLVKTNVYIVSHDGYLFTLRYADAEPPTPPSLLQGPLDADERKLARERELRRGRSMILDADGYIDLRSILAVRRAFELNPSIGPIDIGAARANPLPNDATDEDDENCQWVDQADTSDDEDEGGDDSLSKSDDKMRLKMKRSFELVMRSGRVAYSRKICLEWIARLRDLIKYWTRRHRVDARDEMELVFATQGRARFTIPKPGKEEAPEGYVPDGASPYLAKFWNWCVIEGCRAIVKGGRLYTKKGIRKDFKHLFHVLTGGHLILFHITPNVTSYHHHSRTINLVDAYVYSGQIAMRSLPRAAGVDSRQKIPRRYQDGLESDDSEEDTTFIIWYRPHTIHKPADSLLPSDSTPKSDPIIASLSGKHNLLICKARSRLERDAWVWVLNTEIERMSRTMSARENTIRNQGILVPEP
ncbi:hypothetical protein FRC07_006402 [Ceratobasidium sp. 392]|nr:hypothetical protein FRC07_006402 [Ceratobasidium sp. 392]